MKFTETQALTLLAGVGGVLGYIQRSIRRGAKITLMRAGFEAASAAFVGYLMFQLCESMRLSSSVSSMIVGVSGWLGAQSTIQVLEPILRRIIGSPPK